MTLRAEAEKPVDELAELHEQEVPEVEDALRAFVRQVVVARLFPGQRDRKAEARAIERLREVLGTAAAFADLLGRARLLRELPDERERAKAVAALSFAAKPKPKKDAEPLRAKRLRKLLGLGFDAAVEQMIEATPELARTQAEISRVYERGGFALVKSADLAVTEAVQEAVAKATAKGLEMKTVETAMEALDESFTGAYARLVFRNATTRAYAAGRQQQAREMPGIVGLEYMATHDPDVRKNHLAADGMIAAVEDPAWNTLSPPLGHNCLKPDTPITCVDGPREICQIRRGDLVLTHEGRFRRVVGVHRKSFSGDLVRIRVGLHEVVLTPDHEVRMHEGWKRAGDLTSKDVVFHQQPVSAVDSIVGVVDQSNACSTEPDVSIEIGLGSREVFVALDPETEIGKPEVDPEGREQVVVCPFDAHVSEMRGNQGFAGCEFDLGVGVTLRVFPIESGSSDPVFAGGFWARAVAERRDTGEAGVVFFRSTEGPVIFAALRAGFEPEVIEELLERAMALRPESFQDRFHGDPLDFMPSAESFSQGFVDLGLIASNRLLQLAVCHEGSPLVWGRIKSITTAPHVGEVFTLSVAGDESFVGGGVALKNCRCTTRLVHRFEAERRGLELNDAGVVPRPIVPGKWEATAPGQLPPGAHADEGGAWGRRADAIYRGGGLAG